MRCQFEVVLRSCYHHTTYFDHKLKYFYHYRCTIYSLLKQQKKLNLYFLLLSQHLSVKPQSNQMLYIILANLAFGGISLYFENTFDVL